MACSVCLLLIITATTTSADELADEIRRIDPIVLNPHKDDPDHYRKLLPAMIDAQLKEANAKSTREWHAIKTLEDWQAFRDAKLKAMKQAIGYFPEPPKDLKAQTTRTLGGEGYKIECLVFESRPHFPVTANLYVPDPLPASAPGIIIHPSHHNPKTEGELQDMGMTWARAGCYVLVMDQVGHGERAAHPFASEESYAKPFRVSRQDYWFRYNTGMQLHLVGDSLIGWQAYDLMRGVDLLLTRSHIDSKRIIMMGSVAGGGDPVAVAAALDDRIAGAVIFNFGGPQPETRYPLPDDAEQSFNYAGSGSFESTRNISFSARDGFLPWVIVGSIAPRKLIYAHEFSWDQKRDPVWKRLQQIYEWHGKSDALAFAHGYGSVRESGDKASHCNNIGPVHRKHIDPALEKWFRIPAPKEEYSRRLPASELLALRGQTKAARQHLQLHQAASIVDRAVPLPIVNAETGTIKTMQKEWIAILGDVTPPKALNAVSLPVESLPTEGITIHRFILQVDGLPLPGILLTPKRDGGEKPPVTVMIAQDGKSAFLEKRSNEIAAMLKSGIAVCLPDVRGTGELRLDRHRARTSWDTGVSASALMLGRPMVGQRLVDLRAVIRWLESRNDVDASQLALWGDSFAPVNGPGKDVKVPMGVAEPDLCEPLGGLLALLGALFEEHVKVVYTHRQLHDVKEVIDDWAFHIPHDVVVPGMIDTSSKGANSKDASLLISMAMSGRSIRVSAMVNTMNQPALFNDTDWSPRQHLEKLSEFTGKKYDFQMDAMQPDAAEVAAWLIEKMRGAK